MLKSLKASAQLIAVLAQTNRYCVQSNQPDPAEEIEEIVVTGVLPGPPLWKVTNGEHALWILPLGNLYPKKMEWESERVERLIAGSQEYIAMPYGGHIAAILNPISIIRLMGVRNETTQLLRSEKRLADIVPSDMYQRYLQLKALHFPNDNQIDKPRPEKRAGECSKKPGRRKPETLDYANLSSPAVIMDSLDKWLKHNKTIRRTSTSHVVVDALKSNEVKAWAQRGRSRHELRQPPGSGINLPWQRRLRISRMTLNSPRSEPTHGRKATPIEGTVTQPH